MYNLIGRYNGADVWMMSKEEYDRRGSNLNGICVIKDDNWKMIYQGYIIGKLRRDGSVDECKKIQYESSIPVSPATSISTPPVSEPNTPTVEEDLKEYFRQFSRVVDEFLEKVKTE